MQESLILKDMSSSIGAGVMVCGTLFPLESFKKYIVGEVKTPHKPWTALTPFAFCVIPTTIIQCLMNEYHKRNGQIEKSDKRKIFESLSCGFVGAITGTFVENMVLQAKIFDIKPRVALKKMLAQSYSRPWKSFSMIACRDAIYTMAMFYGNDEVGKWVRKYTEKEEYVIFAIALYGMLGAIVSHPFDNIGTEMQKDDKKITIKEAFNRRLKNHGIIRGFWGAAWTRMIIFPVATNLIPAVKNHLDLYLKG